MIIAADTWLGDLLVDRGCDREQGMFRAGSWLVHRHRCAVLGGTKDGKRGRDRACERERKAAASGALGEDPLVDRAMGRGRRVTDLA